MLKLYLLAFSTCLCLYSTAQHALPDTLGVRELHVKCTQLFSNTGEITDYEEVYYYDTAGLLTLQKMIHPYEPERWEYRYDKLKRLMRMEHYYADSLWYTQDYSYYDDVYVKRTHDVKHNTNLLWVAKLGDYMPILQLDGYQLQFSWKTDSAENYLSIRNLANEKAMYVPDTTQYYLVTTGVHSGVKKMIGINGADTVLQQRYQYDTIGRQIAKHSTITGWDINSTTVYRNDTTISFMGLDTLYDYKVVNEFADTNRITYSVKERRILYEILTDKNGRLLKTVKPDYRSPYPGGTKFETVEYIYTGSFLTGIAQSITGGETIWETTVKKMEYLMY